MTARLANASASADFSERGSMDADQIKSPFLITPYHCSNWFPFAAMRSEKELVIGVIPTPKKAIAVTTGIISLFFFGFLWLVIGRGPEAVWGVIGIGVLTIVGTPLLISLRFKRERSLGPVLIYQLGDSVVNIPRQRRKILVAQIDAFAVVKAHDGSSDWVSQLQLFTKAGERFPLATANTKKELLPLLRAIQEQIKAPVQFLKQKSRNELLEEGEA